MVNRRRTGRDWRGELPLCSRALGCSPPARLGVLLVFGLLRADCVRSVSLGGQK